MSTARRCRARVAPLVALVAFAVAGAGCGHIERVYREPPGGKTARLRIVSDGTVALAPGAACPKFEKGRAGRVQVASGQGSVFAGEIAGRQRGAEVAIQADEPLLVRYEHQVAGLDVAKVCTVDLVFVPREGWRYDAAGEASANEKSCQLTVRAVADESGPLAAPANVENRYDPEACDR